MIKPLILESFQRTKQNSNFAQCLIFCNLFQLPTHKLVLIRFHTFHTLNSSQTSYCSIQESNQGVKGGNFPVKYL